MSVTVKNTDDIFYIPSSRSLRAFANLNEPCTKAFLITSIVICLLGIAVTGLFASGFLMPTRSIGAVIAMGVGGGLSLISLGYLACIFVNHCKASNQAGQDLENENPPPILEEGTGPEGLFQEDNEAIDVHMNLLNNYLSIQDLVALAQVNAFHAKAVLPAIVSKAQKYGYKGNDSDEAKSYIKDLFAEIRLLQKYRIFNPKLPQEKIINNLHNCNKKQIVQLICNIYEKTPSDRDSLPCQNLMGCISKLLDDELIEGDFDVSDMATYYRTQTKMLRFGHKNTVAIFLKLGPKDLVELLLVELSIIINPTFEIAKSVIRRAREYEMDLQEWAETFEWAEKCPGLQEIIDND